jgi:hypothetical protein
LARRARVLLDVSRHRDGLDVFQALSVPSFWQPLVIGLIILFGVIVDTYRRRFSEVRPAVQVLRSKAAGKPVRDERDATTPVVKNVTEEQGASQSSFRSGSLEEDRS